MSRPQLIAEPDRPAAAGPDAALDALARSIWAHGRERGIRAMEALAAVAVNAKQRSPGRRLADIVRNPALFAAWDPADARHAGLRAVDGRDPAFAAALRVARRAMAGCADPVAGADHFLDDGEPWPEGMAGRTPVAMLAGFSFYRD